MRRARPLRPFRPFRSRIPASFAPRSVEIAPREHRAKAADAHLESMDGRQRIHPWTDPLRPARVICGGESRPSCPRAALASCPLRSAKRGHRALRLGTVPEAVLQSLRCAGESRYTLRSATSVRRHRRRSRNRTKSRLYAKKRRLTAPKRRPSRRPSKCRFSDGTRQGKRCMVRILRRLARRIGTRRRSVLMSPTKVRRHPLPTYFAKSHLTPSPGSQCT